jgi:tellurite methyltransferase
MRNYAPEDERETWNKRYAEGEHMAFEPDPFLLAAYDDFIQPRFPKGGSALDVAGGLGRHAIWLAELRWRVTVVDISEIAFKKAQKKAEERGVKIEFLVRDLRTYQPERERYDLVLVFYYLQRELFHDLVEALKPGGLLIYKTYTHEQPSQRKGPKNPLQLLADNELLHSFPSLRTLYYREGPEEKGAAELLAIKPR